MRYEVLGYRSFEEYLDDFKRSLLRTAHTYDFFVDWKKVEANVKEHIVELGLLNSLTLTKNHAERRKLMLELLKEHPKVIGVVPILLAMREKSIEVAELAEQIVYKRFNFDQVHATDEVLHDMLDFCEKTGIIDLFGKIKDAYTYTLGVEVGLDTNARKNRAGKAFSKLAEYVISAVVRKLTDSGLSISYEKEVELGNLGIQYEGQKKVDFLIFHGDTPFAACEVNVYHKTGSKPNEIVRSYIRQHNLLKDRSLAFIWLTDGPGWLGMWNQFVEGARNMDYVLNYSIASRSLDKLLSHMITKH